MALDKQKVLAEFYSLIAEMYMGKAADEDVKAITRAMCDTGQQDVMRREFDKMAKVLKGK